MARVHIEMIVLAFDIERSGANSARGKKPNHTIAIGASVVSDEFKELDNLFLPMYLPDLVEFEPRCWDEFWSKNTAVLEQLKYAGEDVNLREEVESEAIKEFQAFRAKWETYADEHNMGFELASDNNVFDGGFINELINTYTLDLPIPYTASTAGQKYRPFWETHAQQRGLLMSVDPAFNANWGLTKRIAELYDVPDMVKFHDHLPHHDAYTIAFEQQVLLGIRDGRIKRRG